MPDAKIGDLRVWWVTNPPHEGERYPVKNIDEAIAKLMELAKRDLALGDLVVCNVGGLEVFGEFGDNGERPGWEEYYDEEDRDIDQIIQDRAKPTPAS